MVKKSKGKGGTGRTGGIPPGIEAKAEITTDTFRAVMSSVVGVVDEIRFYCDRGGLHIKQIDAAEIAMISLDLGRKAFSWYKYKGDYGFMVDGDHIKNILGMAYTDNIIVKIDKTFTLEFGEGVGSCVMEKSGITPRKEPLVGFTAEAIVDTNKFKTQLDKLSKISPFFTLNLKEDRSYLGVTRDQKDIKVELPFSQVGTIKEINEPVRVKFNIDQLLRPFTPEMLKRVGAVKVSLRSDAPIKIEFQVDDMLLVYWLAPGVEE